MSNDKLYLKLLNEASDEYAELEDVLRDANDENDSLREENGRLADENRRLVNTNKEYSRRITEERELKGKWYTRFAREKAQWEKLDKKVSEQATAIYSLEQKRDQLKQTINDIEQSLKDACKKVGLQYIGWETPDHLAGEIIETRRQLHNAWESNKRQREELEEVKKYDLTEDHQQMIDKLNLIKDAADNALDRGIGYAMSQVQQLAYDALASDRPTNFVSAESAADNSMDAEEQKRKAATHLLRRIDYWRKIAVQRGNAIEEKDERILALEYFVNAANPLINGLYAQLLSEAILGDPELGHVQAHLRLHSTNQMIKQIEDFRQTGIDIV